ncbi:hypothetical protein FOZ63_012041 [Perkinsus olseni]|uniref:Transmembrane protein n=1 Tax=Perkinsus olseni TaxID=32597 RepID=A0A7J6SCJ3_PEROL|nr:hypothetical protein FOZ63_012041 [Perkinsus olseni]
MGLADVHKFGVKLKLLKQQTVSSWDLFEPSMRLLGSKFTLIRYRLLVTNKHWSDSQEVTLGVMVGGSKTLKTEHITDVQEQIDVVCGLCGGGGGGGSWKFKWYQGEQALFFSQRVLWFFLFDFVALTVAAWFQVYYVKSLLMDRTFI